jgi:hypothetical protein
MVAAMDVAVWCDRRGLEVVEVDVVVREKGEGRRFLWFGEV